MRPQKHEYERTLRAAAKQLTTASEPRRSRRESSPKESWGVKDMAGSSDWTGGRVAAKSDGNVWRNQSLKHVVYAPLVYDYLGANRRRRKRATMTGTLRAGAGDAIWAALLGHHPIVRRRGMVVHAAMRPMVCAEYHVVAATGHHG
jgi:hypothetical protein